MKQTRVRGIRSSQIFWPLLLLSMVNQLSGCTGFWPRWFESSLFPADPPPLVLVAPVSVGASISHVSQVYTFDGGPSDEMEPQLRGQLIDELATRTQRTLTTRLAEQPGFRVIPFLEARRLWEPRPVAEQADEEELARFGSMAGADLVVVARIDDYGRLGWRHWVYGWLGVASTHTAIVGAATAWNPLAMGGYLAYDLATDLPLWYGGAYILGWAFRPVHIQVSAIQMSPCVMRVWLDEEVTILAGRKDLANFPEDQRKRKEIQLQVNLDQAIKTLAEAAGKTLRLKACPSESSTPATVSE